MSAEDVTITVVVPVGNPAPPPVPDPVGELPVTGADTGLLLVAALLLTTAGIALRRAARRTPKDKGSVMKHLRTAGTLLLTGLTALSLSGLAAAQTSETTVSTSVSSGSRQLVVTDLAGAPLGELALTPGVPSPFKVTVQDSDYVPTQGFTVSSSLNNLYLSDGAGGYDFTTKIPSGQVDVSFGTSPLSVVDTLVDLNPDYLLSTPTAIDCQAVADILGLSLTDALLSDPICGLLDTLTGDTLSFADVPTDANAVLDIALDSLDMSALPVAIGGGTDAGPYSDPDCDNGIGAGDATGECTSTSGTGRTYLTGTGATDPLEAALSTLLADQTLTTPLVSDGTTSAITTVDAAIQALQTSGTTAVADFGNTLTDDAYTLANRIDLINGLLSAALDTIESVDLAAVTGLYTSFPMLSVDPAGAPDGTYAGTLTVTLVE